LCETPVEHAKVRLEALDETPIPARMIEPPQVAELMHHEVANELGRKQ
jgi:hypothetical protein